MGRAALGSAEGMEEAAEEVEAGRREGGEEG
jgi:hypothetical protein